MNKHEDITLADALAFGVVTFVGIVFALYLFSVNKPLLFGVITFIVAMFWFLRWVTSNSEEEK